MIGLALAVAGSAAIGVALERRLGVRAQRTAELMLRLVLWVALPVVAFANLNTIELDAEVGAGVAYAWCSIGVCLALAYLAGTYALKLARTTTGELMLAVAIGNTGYLGMPLTAALFGLDELPNAILYDLLVNSLASATIGFTIGAAFGTVAEGARGRVLAFLARNPPLWATALAFLAPHDIAPDMFVDATRVLVLAVVPIGFYAVGVTLAAAAEEGAAAFPPPLTAPIATGIAIKLLAMPAVVLLLSSVVFRVSDVYVTQAAMATGISGLAIAQEYGLDRALIAAVIAWTTALVLATGVIASLL